MGSIRIKQALRPVDSIGIGYAHANAHPALPDLPH